MMHLERIRVGVACAVLLTTFTLSPLGLAASEPNITTPRLTRANEAIKQDPFDARAWNERGFLYSTLGENEAAIADMEKAIELDPDNGYIRWSYGWCLYNLGEPGQALEQWEKSLDLYGEDRWWMNHTLAMGYWAVGDKSKALQSYDAAAKAMPDRFGSWDALVEYTGFWKWNEKEAIYTIFDAWNRAYRVEPVKKADDKSAPVKPIRRVRPQLKEIVEGQPMPLVEFKTLSGKQISTRDLKGKVVLIDFWATWCGPCRTEIPGLVKLYDEIKGDGFEILGISFDKSQATLNKYLNETGMSWPQYFDGKGWDNALGRRFGVRSIPTTVLVDRRGNVRHIRLRGERLKEAVRELCAEE